MGWVWSVQKREPVNRQGDLQPDRNTGQTLEGDTINHCVLWNDSSSLQIKRLDLGPNNDRVMQMQAAATKLKAIYWAVSGSML